MNKYVVFKMVDKGHPIELGEVTASSWKNAIRFYTPIEEGHFAVFINIVSTGGK